MLFIYFNFSMNHAFGIYCMFVFLIMLRCFGIVPTALVICYIYWDKVSAFCGKRVNKLLERLITNKIFWFSVAGLIILQILKKLI